MEYGQDCVRFGGLRRGRDSAPSAACTPEPSRRVTATSDEAAAASSRQRAARGRPHQSAVRSIAGRASASIGAAAEGGARRTPRARADRPAARARGSRPSTISRRASLHGSCWASSGMRHNLSMSIVGLHHVTPTSDDAQDDLDFRLDGLGLRLVKKTVNFDNHHVYHFYFGDRRGTPGTIWTTFPYGECGVPVGKKGAGQVTVTSFSVPIGA